MSHTYKAGDKVQWKSEAGTIHGTEVKVHTQDVELCGRQRHGS